MDIGKWWNGVKVSAYVTDIIQILGQKEKNLKALEDSQNKTRDVVKEDHLPRNNAIFEDEPIKPKEIPIVLNSVDPRREYHPPFYVSLLVDNLLLHNCMLDSGASSNVITRKVMEQLNLRIARPYHNVCAMDAREVDVVGIILNLHVKLAKYPDIDMVMDVVVIDVQDKWGMFLSKKWATTLGGYIQKDWTYATIHASKNTRVILHREKQRKQHVENPKNPRNEFVHYTDNFGNYAILSNFMAPPIK